MWSANFSATEIAGKSWQWSSYLVDVLVGLDEVDAEFPEGRRRWIAKPVGYPGLHGVNVRGGLLWNPADSPATRGTSPTAYRGGHGLLGHQAPVKGRTAGPRPPAHWKHQETNGSMHGDGRRVLTLIHPACRFGLRADRRGTYARERAISSFCSIKFCSLFPYCYTRPSDTIISRHATSRSK